MTSTISVTFYKILWQVVLGLNIVCDLYPLQSSHHRTKFMLSPPPPRVAFQSLCRCPRSEAISFWMLLYILLAMILYSYMTSNAWPSYLVIKLQYCATIKSNWQSINIALCRQLFWPHFEIWFIYFLIFVSPNVWISQIVLSGDTGVLGLLGTSPRIRAEPWEYWEIFCSSASLHNLFHKCYFPFLIIMILF